MGVKRIPIGAGQVTAIYSKSTHHAGVRETRRRGRGHTQGLTGPQFDELVIAQLGRCAICSEQMRVTSYIDHDHETDEVRGLLCRECNSGLGMFRDSIPSLRKAIAYLGGD